jgi:hypothetical protein
MIGMPYRKTSDSGPVLAFSQIFKSTIKTNIMSNLEFNRSNCIYAK